MRRFKPGDLVEVKKMHRIMQNSKDIRELGGVGVVVKTLPNGAVCWYDVFIDGQIVESVIDSRVKEYVI